MVENAPRLNDYAEGMPERPGRARDPQQMRRAAIIGLMLLAIGLTLANVTQSRRWIMARNTGALTGSVVDEDGAPVAGAEVAIPGTRLETVSDAAGRFELTGIPPGTQTVLVAYHYVGDEYTAAITPGQRTDLGTVRVITALRPDGRAAWR
jgi:predicted permease